MSRIKQLFRIFFIAVLGLIGVALLLAGLWFAWQGGAVGGVLMVMAAGGMLAGCAWWLLFLAPPQPVTAHKPSVNSLEPNPLQLPLVRGRAEAAPPLTRGGWEGFEPKGQPAPVRVATRHQRLTNETSLQLATPDELRAALLGIGLRRIAGVTWQEACADERWANLCIFFHCERDKLDAGSSDDVDGMYFTREEAEATVSASPQTANYYTWKVFVSASALQYLSDDRKVLPHLVRAIKKELLALPAGECPGTLVELKSWQEGRKAWLDSSGKNIVLFEDENALDGLMFSSEPQTGVFKTDSGMGLFDASGAIILPPRYEDLEHFYNGLAAAKLNGLWGFLDHYDHWQIEPRFLEVRSFGDDGKAKVRSEKGWGVIDRHGRQIVQPAWDSLESGPDKSFRVTREGQCGYINAAGECVAGFQAEPYWLDEYNQFPADVLVLRHPDSWVDLFALADRHARRLTGFDFVWLSRPSEGLLVGSVKQADGRRRSGFLDFTGAWVIPPRFESAYPFSEGLAEIRADDDKWGYINRQGEVVIACQFSDVTYFHEGLAAVQVGEYPSRYYGFIDASGGWVIQPQFDDASVFSQGLAAVKQDDLWGYIGRDGNWAIAPVFNRVWPFSEAGHACVSAPVGNDEWYGMIDRTGQWLLPPRYSGVSDARLIECGNVGLQWVAAARDERKRWGGVMLSTCDADRQVLVPFECGSGDEVFRVLGDGSK